MNDDSKDAPVKPEGLVTENPWRNLRRLTPARIALGRSGSSLPTDAHLDFSLAHALARDAVYSSLDFEALERQLYGLELDVLRVSSAAPDRTAYLMRPDLGRKLSEESRETLKRQHEAADIAFVLADGLSAVALERHALPLLEATLPLLKGYRLAPVTLVEGGRVALGDEVGQLLGARLVVVLIGERPGLSAPDSLGLYITYDPKVGRHDAERNCISNVHGAGLAYAEAAYRLYSLIQGAFRLQLTGVGLKEEDHPPALLEGVAP